MKANKTKQYIHILPQLVYAYNNSVHATTKKTPFDVFFRRESKFAIDRYVKTKTDFNADKMKQRLTKKKTMKDITPSLNPHDTVRIAMTAFTKGRKLAKEDIKRTALRKRGELNRWSPDVFEVLSMRTFDDGSFKY